jgi:ketosteroid isomerase-like protein
METREEVERLRRIAVEIADAIGRRDVDAVVRRLAPGFIHRSPGGDGRDAPSFAQAIRDIPGEILFVKLEAVDVDVDVSDAGALVTGIQHARVRIEGTEIDDRRAFVDWFVKCDGEWRILVAVDLPTAEESTGTAAPAPG